MDEARQFNQKIYLHFPNIDKFFEFLFILSVVWKKMLREKDDNNQSKFFYSLWKILLIDTSSDSPQLCYELVKLAFRWSGPGLWFCEN